MKQYPLNLEEYEAVRSMFRYRALRAPHGTVLGRELRAIRERIIRRHPRPFVRRILRYLQATPNGRKRMRLGSAERCILRAFVQYERKATSYNNPDTLDVSGDF